MSIGHILPCETDQSHGGVTSSTEVEASSQVELSSTQYEPIITPKDEHIAQEENHIHEQIPSPQPNEQDQEEEQDELIPHDQAQVDLQD